MDGLRIDPDNVNEKATAARKSDLAITPIATATTSTLDNKGALTGVGSEGNGDTEQDDENDYEPPLPYSKARCIALVVTTTGAAFTNILSIQAVVIILPTIGKDLGIPDARLQWIVSAYALAFGCFLLLWGRIADLYGMKTIFVLGSAWVTITTAVNPFVKNEVGFDLFRGLQGLGAAANVPTALGILGTTFPPGRAKTYAFSAYGAGAPLGSIFGTLFAGFITAKTSWVWVFGVMAILAGVVTVAGILFIPSHRKEELEPNTPTTASTQQSQETEINKSLGGVDWIGACLITVGLFVLLFSLTQGNVAGWRAPWISVLLVLSLALVAIFVWWQHRLETRMEADKDNSRAPLMKISMFNKSGEFGAAMLIMALFFSSFNGFLVYATYFYQSYQGLGTLDTTLRFLPTGVVGCLTALVVSQLLARVPTWIILLAGNVCVSVSSLIFAVPIDPETSYFATGMIAMSLSVFGADTTWPSLTLFTSHALPREDQALGGALVNAVGQVGRAIGLAVATAVQVSVMARARGVPDVKSVGPVLLRDGPSLEGLRAAAWFNFAVGACAVLVVVVAFRGSGIIGRADPKGRRADGGGVDSLGRPSPSSSSSSRSAGGLRPDADGPPAATAGVAKTTA